MLRFRSRFLVFPVLPGLVSHAFLPGSRTRLPVRFLSPFPDSLPQLFLRCLPFAFAFGLFPVLSASFRTLLSRFRLFSFLFLPFRSLPVSPHSWLPRCSASTFASAVFSVLPDLVSHVFLPGSRTWLSACFFSSFPDSLPAAVPQVLTLCFRFRSFPRSFRFLSSASFPVPTTQPLFLPFLIASRSASQQLPSVLRFHLSAFPILPLLFRPVSRASSPVLSTWLPVCFLSSLPASLPQLFHRCFPSSPLSLLFRAFLLAFHFLSSASARF